MRPQWSSPRSHIDSQMRLARCDLLSLSMCRIVCPGLRRSLLIATCALYHVSKHAMLCMLQQADRVRRYGTFGDGAGQRSADL